MKMMQRQQSLINVYRLSFPFIVDVPQIILHILEALRYVHTGAEEERIGGHLESSQNGQVHNWYHVGELIAWPWLRVERQPVEIVRNVRINVQAPLLRFFVTHVTFIGRWWSLT